MKVLYTYIDANGEQSEELDATPLQSNNFKINQIPTRALGISKDDEIEALNISDENVPEFIRFTKKSGNKTLKILTFKNDQSKSKIIKKLKDEFSEYIELNDTFLVNVLQISDIDEIQDFLEQQNSTFQLLNPNPFDGNLYIPF